MRRIAPHEFSFMHFGSELSTDVISVDVETDGNPWWSGHCHITCVGTCDGDDTEVYWWDNPEDRMRLANVLGSYSKAKVFHNAQSDLMWLMKTGGMAVRGQIHDTISMARCANNLEHKVGLDWLGEKYCKMGKIDCAKPWDLSREDLAKYNGRDCEITWLLWHHYKGRKDAEVWWPTYIRECKLLPAILEMYQNAPNIDYEWCLQYLLENIPKVEKLLKKFGAVNPDSPPQLSKWFFETLKLKPVVGHKKGDKGYSTAEAWLKTALTLKGVTKKQRGAVADILEYRTFSKVVKEVKKYVFMSRHDGRVHGTLKPYTAKTGRWGASDPNLEQIPGAPHYCRRAFRYEDEEFGNEYELYSFDYDQMELRLVASKANDKPIIDAILAGRDVHQETADKVTGGNRDWAKVVIYAYLFGAQAQTMAETVMQPLKVGQKILLNLRTKMPGISRYMSAMTKEHARNKHIINTMGRKLRCKEDYQATDYHTQSDGADILKDRMIRVAENLWGCKTRLILPIHDELVLAVHKSEKKRMLKLIPEIMEERKLFTLPLTVSSGRFYDK